MQPVCSCWVWKCIISQKKHNIFKVAVDCAWTKANSGRPPVLHSSAAQCQVQGTFVFHFFKACPNRLTSSLTSVPRLVRRWRGEHCYLRPQASVVFCQVCEIENHLRWVCVAMGRTSDREDRMKVYFLFWSCWKPIHPNFGRSKNGNENGLLDAQERCIWLRCTHVFTIKHACFWCVFAHLTGSHNGAGLS